MSRAKQREPEVDFETVRCLIADVLCIDDEAVTLDKTLRDLGADSLDFTEVVRDLEEWFGIEIDEDTEYDDWTVAQWVSFTDRQVRLERGARTKRKDDSDANDNDTRPEDKGAYGHGKLEDKV